jgi:beta-lactamase superfamily II metal-dependent hydrolase
MTPETQAGRAAQTLQLFFFGPGVGESIIVRLPCGQWGVVDYYASPSASKPEVLEFLRSRKIKKLAFFCLTHPHADHYQGAHRLLEEYEGRIERIWRYGGLSGKELCTRIISAAHAQHSLKGDPEAKELADDFLALLQALSKAGKSLPMENYRRITAPGSLLKTDCCEIFALRPGSAIIDEVEGRIAKKIVAKGYLLLNEEEGSVLNSLSVVLLIKFQRASVILLGDAVGASEDIHGGAGKFSALKIAHHGSANGLGAERLKTRSAMGKAIPIGVITPYNRSGLPREAMLANYRAAVQSLILTGSMEAVRPRKWVDGMDNPRLAHGSLGQWHGVEIFGSGAVRRVSEAA